MISREEEEEKVEPDDMDRGVAPPNIQNKAGGCIIMGISY